MHLPGFKISLLAAMLFCGIPASWAGDYLYAPQPFTGGAGEGILVREVTVKKGDTLSHLSKRYSGRGYYYPQILLFNEIKNPHRIQIGQVVRVPLAHKAVQQLQSDPVVPIQQSQTKAVELPKKPVEKKKPLAGKQGESSAYGNALEAFRKGDCEDAIKQFNAFISRYPSSTLLPEATLSRAECYLKLSTK